MTTEQSIDWAPRTDEVRMGDRSLFPSLEPFAYLNHAAISPASSEVRRGVAELLESYAARGLGAFMGYLAQRERLRGQLARLIGARPEELALMPSTTRTVVDTALCMPWQAGDRVVCLSGEFPANVTPWQRAAELFDLEIVMLDVEAFRSDQGLDSLRQELERGVRLVAVSAVQFQTGLAMPLAEITRLTHAAGGQVFVDAIQGLGVVPMDVRELGIDYLGCGSQKWLMGMEGAGFLYVRPGCKLVPRVAGWLSHEEPLRFLFEGAGHLRYDRPIRDEPNFLESGAINAMGFVALEASVAAIAHLGVPAIFEHVQRYHDALEPALLERGFTSERHPTQRSGILACHPPQNVNAAALVESLNARGVACTQPDGRVRFAPHWPNSLDEVPRVIGALDAALEAAP